MEHYLTIINFFFCFLADKSYRDMKVLKQSQSIVVSGNILSHCVTFRMFAA